MKRTRPGQAALIVGMLASSGAVAGPVATVAQLDAILGDRVLLEDFEGFSIFGGGTIPAPNPLNSATQPAGWGILPGVTYSSPGTLAVHLGFVHGDDSNVLQGSTQLLVTFSQPQAAVGFDLIDGTGNVPYHDTVVFYHNATELGTLQIDLAAPSSAFAGWQDATVGITSARVTSVGVGFSGLASIDNVEWGIVVVPACPADFHHDGQVTPADVAGFVAAWLSSVGSGTLAGDFDGNGQVNPADVGAFVNAWFTALSSGC